MSVGQEARPKEGEFSEVGVRSWIVEICHCLSPCTEEARFGEDYLWRKTLIPSEALYHWFVIAWKIGVPVPGVGA